MLYLTCPRDPRRLVWGALLLIVLLRSAVAGSTDEIVFSRDIRPILSAACFQCHGPDEDSREADLRLDTREGIVADLGGYAAIIAGAPDESEALRRITSDDHDERMPPVDSGEPLTEEQVDLLRRWIEQGADWSEHWAFLAPKRPDLPERSDVASKRHPVDAFTESRLAREDLRLSPEADRISLLRRLSLDLIGLPPTVDEVDQFLKDDSSDAYARQVDRLLHSPHYGERWGRIWLDAARYADSDGFEKDKPRDVWFYRDWVIDALNRDMPYNQFIIEQIAGDLLPGATQQQRVATGFLRNSMINEEGGIDPEQFRMEAMFDRMDAIGSGVLGLTIRCSQCHSHKYDPLTQEEYYQMFAFLNNCDESQIPVYTPAESRARQSVLSEIRDVQLQLQRDHPDWAERMARWQHRMTTEEQVDWVVAELDFDDSTAGGQKYLLQNDGSYLSQGYSASSSQPLIAVTTKLRDITAIRLELMTDPNLPNGGPGRSLWGTCALSEFEASTSPPAPPGEEKWTKLVLSGATADIAIPEQPLESHFDNKKEVKRVTGPVEFAIDGKVETAWGINVGPGRRNQARKAVFVFSEPISCSEGVRLRIQLKQHHGGWNGNDRHDNNVGRFRISITQSPNPVADPLPSKVRALLDIPLAEWTPAQRDRGFSYWRTTVPQWRDANDRIEQLWRQHPAGTSQLVLAERTERRKTHRLDRGDFLSPKEEVKPGVPKFLHPLPDDAPRNRLTLARWLVDPRSPTTARAIVNRVWQAYFGTGIVRTASDLGSQSETPSHPQLLDWLAVDFMDNDWSLKQLHRTIVTSATYRQSSDVSAALAARDPANRLLARGPRFRVDAELVRDIALLASGLLNRRIGGPSVYPTAPEFLFQPPASYGPKAWNYSTGSDRYRRSMYTFAFRSVPYPTLQTFDAPNGESSCVRRPRSNTPLQALTTLNEPLFVECARALALQTVRQGGETDEDRMTYAFRRCVSRPPTNSERTVLNKLLQRQTLRFESGEIDPWRLVTGDGENKPELTAGSTPSQVAGWTAVARVLLNLDETITKE